MSVITRPIYDLRDGLEETIEAALAKTDNAVADVLEQLFEQHEESLDQDEQTYGFNLGVRAAVVRIALDLDIGLNDDVVDLNDDRYGMIR